MLATRKALIGNLNYVHLQHVSLGVHLSMRSEMIEGPVGSDLKDLPAHPHQYKDSSETLVLVDANSNDPSVPCQCCDQHSSHAETIKYNSNENLETILCEGYLSPDDLPLSLSPCSPSTDSSSSSDFTLDDSPVSMYYKEYAEGDLDTPDQQQEIISLDAEIQNSSSSDNPTDPSHSLAGLRGIIPENTINNNHLDTEDVPFIDWSSDTVLDNNCNALEDSQPADLLWLCSDVGTIVKHQDNANQTEVPHWPLEEDLLPGLPVPADRTSTQTPPKTITSFHELAQKRRKSGGAPQPRKDKSDWLIVFSPDVEQPPVNELTTSAFYHGLVMPQAQGMPGGKEVTTFRELRHRNIVNKQLGLKAKAQSTAATVPPGGEEVNNSVQLTTEDQKSSHHSIDKKNLGEPMGGGHEKEQGGNEEPAQGIQLDKPEVPPRPQNDNQPGTPVDSLSAMMMGRLHSPISTNNMNSRKEEKSIKKNKMEAQRRGTADGGDRRGLEVFGAPQPSRLLLRLSTNLTPPPALLPPDSALEVPRCFALPPQTWYPRLPVRLSPVGAYSPPQRALLPLLDTPDVAILLSPLFPRIRRRKTGPPAAPDVISSDTGGDGELLMADGAEDTLQRDKKNLLIRIGAAVDRIISHFNGSRNQVQKAQLGDSRLSPRLGYLILNSLCPSLFSLFCDGLRPFQKDFIIGRRRLSPWNLVEASIKSGPESLHILFHNVSRFQQLRDPQRRFNAFIFGLLNTKQLDVWVCHLHHIYDQLSVFFYPTGFLPLAATSHPGLAEELLLIVQPLSALTFHTDLLFEHHHLPIQDPPTPQSPSATPLADHWGAPPFQQILDLGGWIAQNFSRNPDREKPKESQTRCPSSSYSSIGAPQDESFYCANVTQQQAPSTGDRREAQKPSTPKPKDSSTTWWGQLSQASRLYIPANKDSSFRNIKGSPDTLQIHPKEPHQRGPQKTNLGTEQGQPSRGSGDPAEAIISGDEGLTPGSSPPCRQTLSGHGGCTAQTPEKGGWFGQLFGAAHSCDSEARNVKSRRPSSWLPPNVNVLNLLRLLSTSEQEAVAPAEERKRSDHKAERSLRALCDHSASGEAQLSFRKGDVLQLLGTVDEDWIRCRRGSDTGLVPVGYTSLIL